MRVPRASTSPTAALKPAVFATKSTTTWGPATLASPRPPLRPLLPFHLGGGVLPERHVLLVTQLPHLRRRHPPPVAEDGELAELPAGKGSRPDASFGAITTSWRSSSVSW